jgi:hypothetical protein
VGESWSRKDIRDALWWNSTAENALLKGSLQKGEDNIDQH